MLSRIVSSGEILEQLMVPKIVWGKGLGPLPQHKLQLRTFYATCVGLQNDLHAACPIAHVLKYFRLNV